MATLLKCEQVLDSLEMAKPVSMSITISHGSWPVHLLVIVSFIGFHYFDLSSTGNGVSSKLKLIHIES